jgi:hypothetical protein
MGCGRYAGISYNAEIVQEIALDRFPVRSVHRGRIGGFVGGGRCSGIAATTDRVARLGRGGRETVLLWSAREHQGWLIMPPYKGL